MVGPIILDEGRRRVTVDGGDVDLSPREFSAPRVLPAPSRPDPVARPAARPGLAVRRRRDAERGRRLHPLPAREAGLRGRLHRDRARRRLPAGRCLTARSRTSGPRRARGRRGRRRTGPARPSEPRAVERAHDAGHPRRAGVGVVLRGRGSLATRAWPSSTPAWTRSSAIAWASGRPPRPTRTTRTGSSSGRGRARSR